MKWNYFANVQGPEKRVCYWEEGLNSLPEGEKRREWEGNERMRMRKMRMTQIIKKESINILFDAT